MTTEAASSIRDRLLGLIDSSILDSAIRIRLGECVIEVRSASALVVGKRDSSPTRFDRVDLGERPDLLAAVIKAPGVFFLPKPDRDYDFGPHAYRDLLEGVPVIGVSGGVCFERAAEAGLRLLA